MYIVLTIFGNIFGCLFLATVRNVKKFLAVARHGQTKMFPNMDNRDLRYIRPYYYALIDSTMDSLKSNILITHYCKIQLEYYSSRSMFDLKKLYCVFLFHFHSTCV